MVAKMIRKTAVILVLICQTALVFAQDKDFGIWYTIAAEKKIVKNLELGVDFNLRTYHDAGEIEEGFVDLGLDYKINKAISAAVSYRFTKAREDNEEYHARHKWFADLKAMDSRKPLYAFLIGQGFNIIITLIVAYLLFQVLS